MEEENFEQQLGPPAKTTKKLVVSKKTTAPKKNVSIKAEPIQTPMIISNTGQTKEPVQGNGYHSTGSDLKAEMQNASAFEAELEAKGITPTFSVANSVTYINGQPMVTKEQGTKRGLSNDNNDGIVANQSKSFKMEIQEPRSISKQKRMQIFYCIDFDTIFPVPGAAVVVAEDEKKGIYLLDQQLVDHRQHTYYDKNYTLQPILME